MTNKVNIHYDAEADYLEIRFGPAMKSYFEPIGNDVFERRDEKTKEIKGFAIFNFRKRTENLKDINVQLPVEINFQSKTAVTA